MEKILFRRIFAVFYSLTIVVFLVVSVFILRMQIQSAYKDLDQMMQDVQTMYYSNAEVQAELQAQFEDDYLNRVRAIDKMFGLYTDDSWKTTRELDEIARLMEVEAIFLVDWEGVITASSDTLSLGLNLYEREEAKNFWPLIEGDSHTDHVVELESVSISTGEKRIYVGVRSSCPEYSMVQISVPAEALYNLQYANSLVGILRNTPTLRSRTIFLVDKETGDLASITQNNDQYIQLGDGVTGEEYVMQMQSMKDGKFCKVNGTMYYIKTTEIGDYILGAMIEGSVVHRVYMVQIGFIMVGFLVIMLVMFFSIRKYLRRYVLDDLGRIEKNVGELLEGHYNVEFSTKYNTEFRAICQVMNDWRDSYKSKSQRMTRIIGAIDQHVGVYECLHSIQSNFFSENMKDILGLNASMWTAVSKSPQEFSHYMKALLEGKDPQTGLVQVGDRYLEIALFESEDAVYGMVMDRTAEICRQRAMEQEAETDGLTGLTNRAGVERRIAKLLEAEPGRGIMLLFDLDRFKAVNDNEGHPEGDKVLRKFAAILKSYFRRDDVVGRLGGDEFVAFITNSVPNDTLANKMNWLVETVLIELRRYHETYGLAVSVGIAYADKDNSTYEALYAAADSALYVVKKNGKNGFYINENSLIHHTPEDCARCRNVRCKRPIVLRQRGLLPAQVITGDCCKDAQPSNEPQKEPNSGTPVEQDGKE